MWETATLAPSSKNLTISGSLFWPIETWIAAIPTLPDGSWTGNSIDAVWLFEGLVRSDQTWPARSVPYRLSRGLAIESASTLTLDPGVVLESESNAAIWIGQLEGTGGELRALGEPDRPVVFGALPDPTATWPGLIFDTFVGSGSELRHVVVRDVSAAAAITVAKDLGAFIRNTEIRNASDCGILRGGTDPWTTDFTAAHLGNTFIDVGGPHQCDS